MYSWIADPLETSARGRSLTSMQIDEYQRAHWIRLGKQRGLSRQQIAVKCHMEPTLSALDQRNDTLEQVMLFQAHPDVCCDRVMSRRGHPTLGPNKKSLGIVRKFAQSFQQPREEEGFGKMFVCRDALRQTFPALM
mmetsp:Transcript_11710/g.40467  ORF Transcript_11710/g.40467 Transcript_11710/m.40467 type:complete len:136 (+) Transcript_11710:410-817(+)